jgi:hypothetical protein
VPSAEHNGAGDFSVGLDDSPTALSLGTEVQQEITSASSSSQVPNAEVKIKVEYEPYDGAYDCLICYESVRGSEALHCSQCKCNPFHRSCAVGTDFADKCPQCSRKSIVPGVRENTASKTDINLSGMDLDLDEDAEKQGGWASSAAATKETGSEEEESAGADGHPPADAAAEERGERFSHRDNGATRDDSDRYRPSQPVPIQGVTNWKVKAGPNSN